MSTPAVLETALRVARGLVEIGAEYQVVGSVASSIHGDPRTTNDIDFVVKMRPEQAASLAAALGTDFDVDVEALTDALRRERSWSIFFLPSFIRIDLFALPRTAYDQEAFLRRRNEIVTAEDDRLQVQSPQDVVLRKLCWYRDGGGVSNQQWRDVVQVLRVQGTSLDVSWLNRWAEPLAIGDLLAKARTEAVSMGPLE